MRLIEAEPVRHGMQKILINDLQQCIYSFERMKKGGIGIADEFVYQTCKRALEYIGKLEAEPVRCGKWRIIHDSYDRAKEYNCSSCDANHIREYNFCPSCGAKMEGNQNGTARKYDSETFGKD